MPRGRPTKSVIRQNVVEILHYLKKGYGYQIARIYNAVFPQVTQRSIYYHLWKGTKTQEIKVNKIKREKGDFSWGRYVEKVYYTLGPEANPKGEKKVEKLLQQWQQ